MHRFASFWAVCCRSGLRRQFDSQLHAITSGLSATRKLSVNVSALSDARFREQAELGEVLCARSIKPFEWSRPRLRRMRAAMGIASMEGAVET
jgi:hypothetical protein